jgi:nucleoside-diphosphate-sugar epimerase
METYLVTGATGIVGSELVRTLLAAPDAPSVRVLLRGSADELARKGRWLSAWVGAPVEVISGDVTRPLDDAGLREVTGVLHAAAATDFEQDPDAAHLQNVIGTRNVLELARRLPRCSRVGLISTAYVAGTRSGLIAEDQLDAGGRFFSEYERSKAVAESEARAAGLPLAVYRLGIIVGRRSDGNIARMTTVYPVWRLAHQGMVPMVPGDPSQPLDLCPVDFAAQALVHLFHQRFEAGATYHVCAGARRSFTLGEFFPVLHSCLAQADPGWARHGYPMPVPVSPEAYEAFVATADLVANPRFQMIVRIVRSFTRPLESPKWFDTRRFDAALEGSGLELEHARVYLPTLVRRAVEWRFRAPHWETLDA